MGNSVPFRSSYSVEVAAPAKPDQSGIRRSCTHPDALVETFADRNVTNCWDLFQQGVEINPRGPCLGRRKKRHDGSLGEYTWFSYTEVSEMAQRLGSALLDLGAVPEHQFPDEVYEGSRTLRQFGLFSKNCVEWLLCEQAANAYNLTLVPLYDTLGHEAVEYILGQTKLILVACSADFVGFLLDNKMASSCLRYIVVFDQCDASQAEKAAALGIKLRSFNDLIKGDKTHTPCPGSSSSVSTLCYTSGTTGNPKGVILTQGNFASAVISVIRGPFSGDLEITCRDVHVSYLPLAHVFERVVCNTVLAMGASIGLYSGDTLKLLDDVRELRPTLFVSVPRLFNRINDRVFGAVREKSSVSQYLFKSGVNTKLNHLRSDAVMTHYIWDRIVFNKIKQLMGGRIRYMLVGGAPLDAHIQDKMKILFCAPLLEGYGLTETIGASFITSPKDPLSGHVGGPCPCVEFCLQSVPEMEYDVTSNPPRGELLVRGFSVFKGYFRDPQETEHAIDKDGWFHTGDVVVLLPNGAVKIIDRKKSIFKLAQGEYVAPEKIENVYIQASLVAQAFAFGYSTKFNLVGIIVPDKDSAMRWAAKHEKAQISFEKLCTEEKFKKAVMADMEAVANENNLKGFQKLKDIFLSPHQFTVENGLLTPTFKLKRHQAKLQFEREIEAMYAAQK